MGGNTTGTQIILLSPLDLARYYRYTVGPFVLG